MDKICYVDEEGRPDAFIAETIDEFYEGLVNAVGMFTEHTEEELRYFAKQLFKTGTVTIDNITFTVEE